MNDAFNDYVGRCIEALSMNFDTEFIGWTQGYYLSAKQHYAVQIITSSRNQGGDYQFDYSAIQRERLMKFQGESYIAFCQVEALVLALVNARRLDLRWDNLPKATKGGRKIRLGAGEWDRLASKWCPVSLVFVQ